MNPYNPGTKEYKIVNNLIEGLEHIEVCIKECSHFTEVELKEKLLELVKFTNKHHEEIVKGV